MWRIEAAAAPTAAAVCLPAFFVSRGLSRLVSAADSAARLIESVLRDCDNALGKAQHKNGQ
jgi:hypothetical protein